MRNQLKSIPKILALLVMFIGMFALTGWIFDIQFLKSILPDLVSMKVNTALGFLLSGITLWLINKDDLSNVQKTTILFCSLFILLISVLSLGEYVFNLNFGIDELLFKDDLLSVGTSYPGRMSPNTAICFIFTALAFLFLSKKFWIAQMFTFLTLAIAYLAFIGYAYNVSYIISFISPTQMALHTTAAFLLLSVGILFSRLERGFMSVILSQNSGGVIARPLLLFAVIIPILLGWLQLKAQYTGLLQSVELGVALLIVSMTTTSIVIIWRSARSLNYTDNEKEQAKTALADLNTVLEMKVTERTKHLEEARKEIEIISNQLSIQNKNLSNFSNIVIHNLRSPMTNITMLVDFIQKSDDDTERNEITEKLKSVTTHLNEVFNELVESIQVKQDTEIESDKIILKDCLKTILVGFESQIKSYEADIQVNFDAAPVIYYPQNYIDSIITNLISNALKYKSPDRKPVIKIKTERINGSIVLSVADNGLGIDLDKHKNNLFKIRKVFHKHPDARGFGLFMTKTQIDAMGGKIWAESIPNVGSTFFVEFVNQNT